MLRKTLDVVVIWLAVVASLMNSRTRTPASGFQMKVGASLSFDRLRFRKSRGCGGKFQV